LSLNFVSLLQELKLDKMALTSHPPPRQWFSNSMNNVRQPGPQPVNVNSALPSAFPQVPQVSKAPQGSSQVPQIPQVSQVSQVPQVPQVPQMSQMPLMPQMPIMPQMPQVTHVPPMQFPIPKWSSVTQPNVLANFPHHVPQQMNHQMNHQIRYPQPRGNSLMENKPARHQVTAVNSTPFVPLQAQKKSRKEIKKQQPTNDEPKQAATTAAAEKGFCRK
jgi:hypothetical protein